MKEIVKIQAKDIIGKVVKDVHLVFENGKIIESGILMDDDSYLRIDPIENGELFVMEWPSGISEWPTSTKRETKGKE